MLNRHVHELSEVYSHLIQDASDAYPTLRTEFERDLSRLKKLASSRGITMFVIDLPAAGKHFDRCLAAGQYTTSGLPLTKRCPRCVAIPDLFRGLYLLVFDKLGCLKENYDVEAIFFLRQFFYCAKKASLDCSPKAVEDEVLDFFKVDDQLPEPEGFWSAVSPTNQEIDQTYQGFGASERYLKKLEDGCSVPSIFLDNLDKVAKIVCLTLGHYDAQKSRFKHGPGAVSERTGTVNKYEFVNWSDRLESAFPIADCGFHNYASWVRRVVDNEDGIGNSDPCSRLIAVPKTLSRPRLIAAEPTEHQWCQQNIWHHLERSCRESWIQSFVRFKDQTLNQLLCRNASGTHAAATLDLSSASDRVTCHVVGQFFCHNLALLQALRASRTRIIKQELVESLPSLTVLKKFSTMGSACTFPVQSLLFVSIALASVLTIRKMRVSTETIGALEGEVAVFGDDIIVPMDSRELMCNALDLLDFKVNLNKSFWTGSFRESCGIDAYSGVSVTPAYWRNVTISEPESIASKIEVTNNFYMKGLWHTAHYLRSTVPMGLIPKVSIDSGVLGFKSFCRPSLWRFRRRWNSDLQRDEVLIASFSARQSRTVPENDSILLQFFTEKPMPHEPWAGGIVSRVRLRLRRTWTLADDVVLSGHIQK